MTLTRTRWRRVIGIALLGAMTAQLAPPLQRVLRAQSGGFCAGTGAFEIQYQGTWYFGTAIRDPEPWYSGWFTDSYTFQAVDPLTGNYVTGHFEVSETTCLIAGNAGIVPVSVRDVTFHHVGDSSGGLLAGGGGGGGSTGDGGTTPTDGCLSVDQCPGY